MYLLKKYTEVPDLLIFSDEEYRLYTELKRIILSEIQRKDVDCCSYKVNGKLLYVENGAILITNNQSLLRSLAWYLG